jgi:hypothetical protein
MPGSAIDRGGAVVSDGTLKRFAHEHSFEGVERRFRSVPALLAVVSEPLSAPLLRAAIGGRDRKDVEVMVIAPGAARLGDAFLDVRCRRGDR